MTSRAKHSEKASAPRRERRVFSEGFKREAVQLLHERRAAGVTVTQVGRAMRETLDAELAVSAVRMAIGTRRPAPGLIRHFDRGSQYACAEYQAVLAAPGMRASMNRKCIVGTTRWPRASLPRSSWN